MAGIGVKLNKIYGKNTLTTDLIGMGYSTVVTIEPMLAVIGAIVAMEYFLDFSSVEYSTRELFSCTMLYIFIFALLTASPFNSVLSRYMSDVIYEEKYEERWISFMFSPVIVDLWLWYWLFIRCCIFRSARIIRKFPFSF